MDLRTQREFLIDIEELVEQLFTDIEKLRRKESKPPQRRELLDRIFRHLHSIKGVASTAGFADVGTLAHQTESLLDNARAGRVVIEDQLVDTLEQAADAISESLSAAAAGVKATDPPADLIQSFHDFKLEDSNDVDLPLPELPAELSTSINDRERLLIREALREEEKLYLVTVDFSLLDFDRAFNELRTTLTQDGTVITSLPSADSARPDRVVFKILCSAALEPSALQSKLSGYPQITVDALTNNHESGPGVPDTSDSPAINRANQPSDSSVRIQIDELDRLISSAHELFGQTVAALDLVSDKLPSDARVELRNLDAQIRESLVALEERIIQLRMVSLERVLQRAVRAGRVAAKVSGKEVEFSAVGGSLRIDKMLCDAIADPLLHLVRNAVDQGIETSDERVKNGKSRKGSVRIEVSSTSGLVRFLVSDDGRGIDPQLVSQAAAKLGLVNEGTVLSGDKSLRMIFRPGFSTTTDATTVSGRGVGLDIVENSIERVGGAVRVRTEVGQGTEFEIRLPASLGVMRALVLASSEQRYCVDASVVVGDCALRKNAAESIEWQDQSLPLLTLRSLLSQADSDPNENMEALICQVSAESHGKSLDQRNAIAVKAVEGIQEVLVRSLGQHSAMWPGIVGATELWDGTVALVLDLPLLVSLHTPRN